MTEYMKIPVSERAVLARVNRRLRADGLRLLCRRGQGDYLLVDPKRGVQAQGAVLSEMAGRLGVLRPWETLMQRTSKRRMR